MPGLKQRLHPVDQIPSRIQHRPDQQTTDTRFCPSLLVHLHLKSLQKCEALDQATRKRNFFHLQKEHCAPGTQTRIADIDNRFCRGIEKSFCAGKVLPEHFVFGQYTSPLRIIVLSSYPQSGVNALQIVIALNYFTFVCNVISVLVEMVNLAMAKVDSFCKNKLIAM